MAMGRTLTLLDDLRRRTELVETRSTQTIASQQRESRHMSSRRESITSQGTGPESVVSRSDKIKLSEFNGMNGGWQSWCLEILS